jgi:hypothetical protein
VRWIDELWTAVRDTSFVAAQVVTLGIVAMVLGLLALNALVHHPAANPTPAGPSHRLAALVPTIVPDTPTPVGRTATPTPRDPVATPTPVATATPQTAVPAQAGQPTPVAPPPTAAPEPPPPTATPAPPPPTAAPAASPTSSVPGQLMKVLPAADGLPARVRAQPNTKAPIVVRVPIGAKVEVIGSANGDEVQPGNPRWLKVKWNNVTGYVYSTLLGEA